MPGRRDHADLGRAQPGPGGQQQIPGLGVVAGAPDRVARSRPSWVIDTVSLPPSVHSTGMTASAPAGSSAPVMILIACARVQRAAQRVAGRDLGRDRQPHRLVRARRRDVGGDTAYPSIAELSKPGSGQSVVTSAASTAPWALASVIGISSGVSGRERGDDLVAIVVHRLHRSHPAWS